MSNEISSFLTTKLKEVKKKIEQEWEQKDLGADLPNSVRVFFGHYLNKF